jgi:hypothetical protein
MKVSQDLLKELEKYKDFAFGKVGPKSIFICLLTQIVPSAKGLSL